MIIFSFSCMLVNITKLIYSLLSSAGELTASTGGLAVYPVIAEAGATLPYAVYSKSLECTSRTKDCTREYAGTVTVSLYASEYMQALAQAEHLWQRLSVPYYRMDGVSGMLKNISLQSESEEWADEAYCVTLTFTFNYE